MRINTLGTLLSAIINKLLISTASIILCLCLLSNYIGRRSRWNIFIFVIIGGLLLRGPIGEPITLLFEISDTSSLIETSSRCLNSVRNEQCLLRLNILSVVKSAWWKTICQLILLMSKQWTLRRIWNYALLLQTLNSWRFQVRTFHRSHLLACAWVNLAL